MVSFEGDSFFFSIAVMINGIKIPTIKQMLADAKCWYFGMGLSSSEENGPKVT